MVPALGLDDLAVVRIFVYLHAAQPPRLFVFTLGEGSGDRSV